MTAAKKARGRPAKAPEKGKRQNYTFRLHDATRERLVEAATVANRTLSEEIEYRIERSFIEDANLGPDLARRGYRVIHTPTGKMWAEPGVLPGPSSKFIDQKEAEP